MPNPIIALLRALKPGLGSPMPRRLRGRTGPFLAIGMLALLSACATQHPATSDQAAIDQDQTQEAAAFRAHTRAYTPPGPPEDPWRPYIIEAAQRYDVPERWIREVMRVESGGHAYENGEPITSPVGAMGLMQVMPDTYSDLRTRYPELGPDPYEPHNSILAGAAYIREMYDAYGKPGFLVAYNAGPHRLDDYLNRNRPLPDETRRYVSMIGPYIADSWPNRRSPAEQYAANALPLDIPPGPRFPVRLAAATPAEHARHAHGHDRVGMVQVIPLPPQAPQHPMPRQDQMIASAVVTAPRERGFHLINNAYADTLPARHDAQAGGAWAIQVGAFGNEGMARAATSAARDNAHEALVGAHPMVASVPQGHGKLWRARFTGLSREAAVQACERLSHGHAGCTVLSPDAQS